MDQAVEDGNENTVPAKEILIALHTYRILHYLFRANVLLLAI